MLRKYFPTGRRPDIIFLSCRKSYSLMSLL